MHNFVVDQVSFDNFNSSVLYWHDKNYTFVLPKHNS